MFSKSKPKLESEDEDSDESTATSKHSLLSDDDDERNEKSDDEDCVQLQPNEYKHVETLNFPAVSNMIDYFSNLEKKKAKNKKYEEDQESDEESSQDRPIQVIRFECCEGQFPQLPLTCPRLPQPFQTCPPQPQPCPQSRTIPKNSHGYCSSRRWPQPSGCQKPFSYTNPEPLNCPPAQPELTGRNMPYLPSLYAKPSNGSVINVTPDGSGGWNIQEVKSQQSRGNLDKKGKNKKVRIAKKSSSFTSLDDEEDEFVLENKKSKKKLPGGKKK